MSANALMLFVEPKLFLPILGKPQNTDDYIYYLLAYDLHYTHTPELS